MISNKRKSKVISPPNNTQANPNKRRRGRRMEDKKREGRKKDKDIHSFVVL